MSTDTRWTWLLALPVLCCAGHAVLLALGVGSLAALMSATPGRTLLAPVGAVVVLAAVVVAVLRRRARDDAPSGPPRSKRPSGSRRGPSPSVSAETRIAGRRRERLLSLHRVGSDRGHQDPVFHLDKPILGYGYECRLHAPCEPGDQVLIQVSWRATKA